MSDPDETINQPINLTINMASVQDDGYTFQTKTLTNLPTEMLTHILENASLKDALSFGQTNRDAFDVVSRNPNFANRACTKEFFTKPDTQFSIQRICKPGNTEFFSSTEKFCRDKAQDYLCGRVFNDWANLIPLGPDGSYAVPDGFEAMIVLDYFRGSGLSPKVKILKIPDSVRAIYGIGPYWLTEHLEGVEGMNNVKIIGNGAFSRCISLSSITIPNSVTEIGHSAFEECQSLTSITIPKSVTKIDFDTFSQCHSLRSITIPNTVTEIGVKAFFHCRSLKSFTIPHSVTEITYATFDGCYGLESVTIPSSVTEIAAGAFHDCRSLTAITFPNSIKKIGRYAFYECESLASVAIPDGVREIAQGAFFGCESLTTVIIPNSVKVIGKEVFYGCDSLRDVTIPYSFYKSKRYIFQSLDIKFTFT